MSLLDIQNYKLSESSNQASVSVNESQTLHDAEGMHNLFQTPSERIPCVPLKCESGTVQ